MLRTRVNQLMIVAVLSGCAATPELEYRDPSPDLDGFMKFTLPQSTVLLRAEAGTISALVVTDDDFREAEKHSLMVNARKSLLTSTTITKFEYVDKQNVVKAISTTAESSVSKVIGIAKELTSFAASTAPGTTMAFEDDIIDPFVDAHGEARKLPINRKDLDCNLRLNKQWRCRISIEDYSPWAITYDAFHTRALNGQARKVFPTPACVRATIFLTAPSGYKVASNTMPQQPDAGAGSAVPGAANAGQVNADGTLSTKNSYGTGAAFSPIQPPMVSAGDRAVGSSVGGTTQAGNANVAKEQVFTFSVELADPSRVNLTRLRAGGDLVASGPCRMNVTNDKAQSNLDTEAFTEAINLAKALKARPK